VKARVPATVPVATGDRLGLAFNGARLSVFGKEDGRAVRTALYEGAAHG
jgi:multiple sugar transport system ATP-binding protein